MALSYFHNNSNIHYKSIGRFQKYDHGPSMNMLVYKNPKPPEYNLSNIQTKVHIIYGQNDHIVKAEVCFFHLFVWTFRHANEKYCKKCNKYHFECANEDKIVLFISYIPEYSTFNRKNQRLRCRCEQNEFVQSPGFYSRSIGSFCECGNSTSYQQTLMNIMIIQILKPSGKCKY